MNSKYIVKCPYCGAEYHLSELYLPKEFFGKPEVVKDRKGKIEHISGEDMNLVTDYECDYCNKKFIVTTSISAKALGNEFEEEYTTPIFENRNELNEE